MSSEALFLSLPARSGSPDGLVDRERIREMVSALYLTRRDLIFRYVVSINRNPADAEEITQEAFLRLYRHCAAGQPIDNVVVWLKCVAHHLSIDRLRHVRLEPPHMQAFWDLISDTRADPAPNAEQRSISGSRMEEIRRLLSCLSEMERQCLELRATGLQFREIGALLNVSLWTAVHHTNRGIAKLKDRVSR